MIEKSQLRIGLLVRSNREFSGVPAGTLGEVVAASNSWPDTDSVAIKWHRKDGPPLTDWFALDELEFLDAGPQTLSEAVDLARGQNNPPSKPTIWK
jgi:hypothetical protein